MDTQACASESASLFNKQKRNSDGDMYLAADEQVDIQNLISGHDSSYIFPRDDQLNYICVFQGCTKPILRGLKTDEYLTHLREHVTLSDRLLSNMLRRVNDESDGKKRRRANSTNTYNLNMVPKKTKEILETPYEKDEMFPLGSPESPSGDSPPSTPRKRAHSTDEYNIPLKPSSRGVQLRDQMLRYGLHLFRIDAEGKYICFFDECSLHMMTNFSRHIAKHEKNGDKIKQELLHLCSPAIVQQQLQQHPNLHPPHPPPPHPHPSHGHSSALPPHAPSPSLSHSGPLQALLYRQQQETLQLQQQQQQQLHSLHASPHQLEQIQNFHLAQFQQLQMQHKQQLKLLQHSLISSPSLHSPPQSPMQQISQQNPSSPLPHLFSPQDKQPLKPSVPELSLLSQVQNEADLALMRTQISKMLEESSSRRLNKPRSISLAYSPSPSSSSSSSSSPPTPIPGSFLSPSSASSTPHLSLATTPRTPIYSPSPSPSPSPSSSSTPPTPKLSRSPPSTSSSSSSPSSSSSTPSPPPPSNEIQWVFSKTKPVLTK